MSVLNCMYACIVNEFCLVARIRDYILIKRKHTLFFLFEHYSMNE